MQKDEIKILSKIKTLLADDFATIRKQYIMMLNELGITNIVEADNGKEAWDILCQHQKDGVPFQLIISDINMPVMNGIDLLQNVRRNPDTANLPFLIISSENEQETVLSAIELKVDNFIIKPITRPDLEDRLIKIFF